MRSPEYARPKQTHYTPEDLYTFVRGGTPTSIVLDRAVIELRDVGVKAELLHYHSTSARLSGWSKGSYTLSPALGGYKGAYLVQIRMENG